MLTDGEKQQALEQEKFIADVLKIRRTPPREKKWWTIPAITTTITAVLTVAVTSLGTYYMQTRLKSQEFALSRQDLRLTQTRDAMITVYELLATLLKGTEDRAKMAAGQYDALPDSMFNRIVQETNTIDDRWRRERETAEAGVYLYFGDRPETVAEWVRTRSQMQIYADCAEQAYGTARRTNTHVVNACNRERIAAESSFAALRDALISRYRARLGS